MSEHPESGTGPRFDAEVVPLRILHVIPAYFPAAYWGGPIFCIHALNNALAAQPGVELKVLTTDTAGPGLHQRIDPDALDHAALFPHQTVVFTRRVMGVDIAPGLLLRLPGLIRWADVVHLSATYSFPTLPTLLCCRLLGKPVVWSHHGAILEDSRSPDNRARRKKRAFERICNLLAAPGRTRSHATSEPERQIAEARVPRAPPVLIPNGVELPPPVLDREWQPGGQLRIMYLGRLAPIKGLENLLLALASLQDASISLKIYGTGPADYEAKLRRLAASLELAPTAVEFMGQVVGPAKTQAFDTADICVVPSFSENFCMVVAEALAHGVPVIASRGTPWPDLTTRGCGLWVDNSPDSLAEAIQDIRSMPLAEMGLRGRGWVQSDFDWDRLADRMRQTYESLLDRGDA